MLSQKFAGEKQSLKFEMLNLCDKAKEEKENTMRQSQISAISDLTYNLESINEKQISNLKSSLTESCDKEKQDL